MPSQLQLLDSKLQVSEMIWLALRSDLIFTEYIIYWRQSRCHVPVLKVSQLDEQSSTP